jgi:hypothetical protein
VALVAFAAIPFALIDPVGYPARLVEHTRYMDDVFARRDAEAMEAARRWEARMSRLGPDSPLASWLEYVNGSSDPEPLHQQALDGARRANSRQADAVALLGNGQIERLAELWRLELAATPALCVAYDRALHQLATTDDPYVANGRAQKLERQLPNVRFLLAAGCDLVSGLGATEAHASRMVADNPRDEHWAQFLATLGALRRGR